MWSAERCAGGFVECEAGPRSTRAWRMRCIHVRRSGAQTMQLQARPGLGDTSSLRFFARLLHARAPPFVYALGAFCAISSPNRAHTVHPLELPGYHSPQLSSFGRVSTRLVTTEQSNPQPRPTSRH